MRRSFIINLAMAYSTMINASMVLGADQQWLLKIEEAWSNRSKQMERFEATWVEKSHVPDEMKQLLARQLEQTGRKVTIHPVTPDVTKQLILQGDQMLLIERADGRGKTTRYYNGHELRTLDEAADGATEGRITTRNSKIPSLSLMPLLSCFRPLRPDASLLGLEGFSVESLEKGAVIKLSRSNNKIREDLILDIRNHFTPLEYTSTDLQSGKTITELKYFYDKKFAPLVGPSGWSIASHYDFGVAMMTGHVSYLSASTSIDLDEYSLQFPDRTRVFDYSGIRGTTIDDSTQRREWLIATVILICILSLCMLVKHLRCPEG